MTLPTLVLTGASGQLGLTIQSQWSACDLSSSHDLLCLDLPDLDIVQRSSIDAAFDSRSIETIINVAGYTAVDKAESEKQLAYGVNATGADNLAQWAAAHDARLIHVSTDFVFDGAQQSPYAPHHQTRPVSIYGASKLAGEAAVSQALPEASLIVRTSWLFSPYGTNFVKTMLRLMRRRQSLDVVADQIGSPTSAATLARLLLSAVSTPSHNGIYHWCDGGQISWYDFALAIQTEGLAAGILHKTIEINPVGTDQYPTAARRPAYSVLDRSQALRDFAQQPSDWKEQLRLVVQQLASTKWDQ
jgi:dTDP-4-dehydrorhamnose reductase